MNHIKKFNEGVADEYAEKRFRRIYPAYLTSIFICLFSYFTTSFLRSSPSVMNLTLRLAFVILISPVKGIFRLIPDLWRMENLPKEFSFSWNPFTARLFNKVCSSSEITTLMMCSASFFVRRFNVC